MVVFLLLAIFGVAQVLSQATHNAGGFTYQGCSNIDLSCFGSPIVLPDGRLTPEACQTACRGHQFSALLPDACRCGDDPKAVHAIDESKCDHACISDRNMGMCGSVCPDNAPGIANIYTRVTVPTKEPVTGGPSSPQTPPGSAETSCSSSVSSPYGQPPETPRITPVGPAPEAPTPTPQSQGPQESPCSSDGNPTPGSPVPPVPSYQGPPSNAPEPSAYPNPTQPTPAIEPYPNPPGYSPDCEPSSPDPYSNDPQQSSPGNNCGPPGGSNWSPGPSESTLWSRPSSSKPVGDPPVPSQVLGSDSPHEMVPLFSSIGGILLIAAMMM
ncbi:hypothetical protein PT974_08126 [Cladobotryum mycophilum]|uniref:WSC domain-containing protein n=1 Tax=Cladobotryum mycophilum TaxID=491253 RepID=A0ABR0SCH2_9HYPO